MVAEQEYVGPPLVGVDSSWKIHSLESICDGVFDCPHSTPKLVDEGIFMVRTQDIRKGYFDTSNAVFVSQETYEERIKRAEPSPGDILFSREGTYFGDAAEIPPGTKVCLGQRMVLIRPKSEIINPSFLRIWINSATFQNYLLAFRDGTVAERLNMSTVRTLPIPVPPLPEQKSIAHILGTLDDKIELNRRMNSTLEGMAQALFKSWFVDFDPVIDNALDAGNPIPDELAARAEVRRQALADGTANREAAKPFPAAFQETESMGWIPEGWEVTAISEAISVNPSTKLKKGDLAPFADMKALPTSGYAIDGVIEKANSGGAKFQNGDVLLARITPCLENGKTGIVDFLTDSDPVGFGSTEFIVLRGEGDLSTPFVACLARDSNFRKHCVQSMIGSSGRQRVHNSCFDSYYLALPKNRDVVSKFNGLSVPAFSKAARQSNENKILTKLRDTLLPKLISGELAV